VPNLDLVPSSIDLVGAEIELISVDGRERRLRDAVLQYRDQYDYILVDSPPSLGLLTLNVLTASDKLIVPVQAEYYALEGLSELVKTVDLVERELNPGLEIFGILVTMFDRRNNLAKEVEADLRDHFGEKVFQVVIPRSVRLSEAPSHGKPVILYDPLSSGAQSYREFAREFLARLASIPSGSVASTDLSAEKKEASQWSEGHSDVDSAH
jgi:chromosome partitioning protein